MTERDWSDDDARLVAYLDGVLPEAGRRTLERDLETDADLKARLDAMQVDLARVRAELDAVLDEAPQAGLTEKPGLGIVGYAAAACFALALLFGGWSLGRQGPSEDWRDFAAAYHLLYRTETLAGERVGDGGIGVVSSALGRDLSPLTEVQGLDFRRAQVLGWQDQPLVQLAYLDAQGRPFAICVIEASESSPLMETAERHGLPTASFHTGVFQVMVIGAAGIPDVSALTHEVSRLF